MIDFKLRTDDQWNLLWQEATTFSQKHNISVTSVNWRQSRQTRLSSRVSNCILTGNTVGCSITNQSKQDYKINVYFPTLDVILLELKQRFSDTSISLMKSIDSLRPKSQNFLSTMSLNPLLAHYKVILPTGNIENEIETFKSYLQINPLPPDSYHLHDVLDRVTPVKEAFPILAKCLLISMTIGTSTATVERSFSSLRYL